MKKRKLPIPLVLLTPIVLLVIVIIAGIYRFSLTDEEIMAKFPAHVVEYDPIVRDLFSINSPNPWTIAIPETHAFALINQFESGIASGNYSSGAERGVVSIDSRFLTQVDGNKISGNVLHEAIAVMSVSNQGSGLFYYLVMFRYDDARQRMVLTDEVLLGDRIDVSMLKVQDAEVAVVFYQHAPQQAMAEKPNQKMELKFTLTEDHSFKTVE